MKITDTPIPAASSKPETPGVMYLVHEPGEGIYGIADSVEAAQAVAAERVEDYFGRPIEWTARAQGSEHPYWEGTYHAYARQTAIVLVEQHRVRTLADTTNTSGDNA